MKIEITTSVKSVALANLILLEGVRSLRMKPDVREKLHITEKDLILIEKFRVKLGRALLNTVKKKVDEEYDKKKKGLNDKKKK